MSTKFISAIAPAMVLVGGMLSASSVRAQDSSVSSLGVQLSTQYKMTKMGTDLSVTELGTVLVIQKDGLLGVPPASVALCPVVYKDGIIQALSIDEKAHCGKDVRKLNVGEKVYVMKVDANAKKDTVTVLVAECGSCNGAPQSASYKSQIVFQFPAGYLAAADAAQIEDVISLVLTIDNGSKDAQQHVPAGEISAAGLPNEEIIKLVQAKLPDSVVIAKIKSSSSEFDTSTDALIKLKKNGASDLVLQAIVDAQVQSVHSDPVENPPTGSANMQPDSTPACSNYDSCIKIAESLRESSQWDRALARYQEASQLDPSRGDAWAGMGSAYFQMGKYDDSTVMFDKALQLGSTLKINVCHAKALCGDTGTFLLSMKGVSFVNKKGENEFAAAPSAVTSEGAVNLNGNGAQPAYFMKIRFAEKNYRFYYLPKVLQCRYGFICPEPGPTQQKTFADYVHQTLVRMAAGDFGTRATKP